MKLFWSAHGKYDEASSLGSENTDSIKCYISFKGNKHFKNGKAFIYLHKCIFYGLYLILTRRSRIFRLIFKKCRNFMDLNKDNTAHNNHKWHDSQSP